MRKFMFLWALLLCLAIQLKAQNSSKPNVIVILADDLGYQDVGFNGCKDIPTPHIDRIAKNGVKFTNGYVTYAVCGPSRAGLITGRYQDRFGYSRNPLYAPQDVEMGLPLTEETMADILKKNGYYSTAIGKWHLGTHPDLHPQKRGFNEFFGFLEGGHHYMPEMWTLEDDTKAKTQYDGYKTKILRNTTPIEEKEYLTDALSREAVSFIDKNAQKPFFIYLAYNAPHTPLQATSKYLNRFSHIQNPKRKTYAAMVSAMDDGIGAVLKQLEDKGLDKNTIVVFLSDNGGPENDNASDNGPLRGQKSNFWDGGIKVPFAIQWPAKIKAGTVYEKPVISLDILATVAATVKSKINPEKPLDGVNLLPYLNGENKKAPHEYLFWRNYDKGVIAVRTLEHKIVVTETHNQELFNSLKDISEKANLYQENKQAFDKLMQQWKVWNGQLKEPLFLGLTQEKQYNELHPKRFVFDK
ncbi:sulfatase family protein [Pedobacter puniceum]|uniref:Sulfatase-like hydrolase/transferase n=1 Tax=Pedobacter puniceum TaxID=2666136 RepID=A0A7K0FM03_9SPHI|nr:sulfatase-like hydrolase/transferase [Pedobacter puniceum]MRX46996.1 sulfatase-like hydrolase/transferase [Pedobacter puniceum]